MDFKPFSLSKAINESQVAKLNQFKLAAMQDEMDRKRSLRQMAGESVVPTYGRAEGPPTQVGAEPQIQTGEEYSPELHAQKLGAAGETDEMAKIQDYYTKASEEKRENLKFETEKAGRVAFTADTPEKWIQQQQAGNIPQNQSFERRQFAINAARTVKDLTAVAEAKPPIVRNFREGEFIVNKQWMPETQSWIELSRGKATQQQINLRSKPSEVAAGKEFDRILDQSNTAEDQLAVVHRAKALLPTIETGKMEPVKKWAREWGDAFGVPIDTEKMTDAVSFRATMKQAVLDGMKSIKGTASEADRKTVEDSVASLESPEEANKFLLDVSESMARRKIEQANFWDRYASANNSSLLGAKSAWSKRIGDIPLVKQVKGNIYHYYQFKDQVIAANRNAFRSATEDEVNQKVDDMWMRGQ